MKVESKMKVSIAVEEEAARQMKTTGVLCHEMLGPELVKWLPLEETPEDALDRAVSWYRENGLLRELNFLILEMTWSSEQALEPVKEEELVRSKSTKGWKFYCSLNREFLDTCLCAEKSVPRVDLGEWADCRLTGISSKDPSECGECKLQEVKT